MAKACLVIVFNHRYDKNIPVLEKIYAGRFSHIYFLVPFYDGSHPNAIPVYESSHYFQSFFAQGYSRFVNKDCTHYIFVGDDCILNPAINESNFLDRTGIPADADFIPGLNEFKATKGEAWWHTFKGIDFFSNRKGAEIRRELPSREEAIGKFRRHGLNSGPLSMENIFGTKTPATQKWWKFWLFKQYHFRYKWKAHKKKGQIELPYPIAGSYSDIVIVTDQSIYQFCRYCGIMAAAGLFVEIAIPTALLLVSEKIVQEKDLLLQGEALWTTAEIEAVEKNYNRSLSSLLQGFPSKQLFYHPVKLSKWNNDL
jgi:hypothetical protein